MFLALSVVPRRGLQQCYNSISVFILVSHVFMSSLLIQSLVQHHLSRVRPIQLRDFPLYSSEDMFEFFRVLQRPYCALQPSTFRIRCADLITGTVTQHRPELPCIAFFFFKEKNYSTIFQTRTKHSIYYHPEYYVSGSTFSYRQPDNLKYYSVQ